MLVPILAGAVLGGLLCMVARRRRAPDEMRILAVGLAVAALIYVGFALAGADRRWLAIEAVGLAGFAGIAWLGLRDSAWWLALGWAAHAGWDVGLHLDRAQSIVGAWYPLSCVGVDLVVAGFVLSSAAAVGPHR